MAREKSSRSSSEGRSGGEKEKFRQGETPGAGEYKCISCEPAWKVTLDSDDFR